MAASNAGITCWINTANRITFALRLNTGAVNSGAAGLQAQVSQDGGTFVNTTNSPVEIATSSGVYYLDLIPAEMNGATVAVLVKSSTSGAVPYVLVIYTQSDTSIVPTNARQIGGSVTAGGTQARLLGAVFGGTVDTSTYAATTVDFECTNTTNYGADFFKGRSLIFTSGNLNMQACRIVSSAYSANNKLKLTVTALTAAPANAIGFSIV